MKRLSSSIFNFALAAQTLSFLCVGSVYGLIIKVRHYDFIRGGSYDLTLCRPLGANKVVLLEKYCDGISSMPGWRARELDGSDYQPPRTVLDLFGPPFGPVTEGTYEEPRPWASWAGSLFYNKDPWKPVMFRSSYNPEEGYEWRLPPFGRVLRRSPSFNRPNARVILDYEAIKRYGEADCRAVQFIISDTGYIDSSYPVLPPQDPYPLDLIPITEESSSTGGSTAGSLPELNDQSWTSSAYATSSDGSDTISETSSDEFDDDLMSEDDPEWDAITKALEAEWEKNGQSLEDINMDDAKVEQVIRQYWASPEAENFDQDVLRYQIDSLGTVDDLEAEIARLEDEDLQNFLSN
ncbi:hypothetical protein TWF679_005717 [Orbilia oligospora]|uniref:Uncharacterized protein n=1 Tax=Orbilia oligospora TaxID=2813651 RepID=A0A8H8VB53_ORBOL|nr:hypothetical protein TWF679_005717 [Orbilia oligospora]